MRRGASLTLSCALLFACGGERVTTATAAASLTGAICDESTKVFVPEATVVLLEQDGKGTIISQQEGLTDQEGRFEFKRVASGTHVLRAEKGAFRYQAEVTVRGTKDTALPIPECGFPVGSVTGRICDARVGEWVSGASVYVVGPQGAVSAAKPSGADGSFSIDGVPSGARDVIADNNGYKIVMPVEVRAGESVDLGVSECVKGDLSNIEGRICANAQGQWLSDASVTTSAAGKTYTAKTDIEGRYVLKALPPGHYQVTVEKGAYRLEFETDTEASKTTRFGTPMCTPNTVPVVAVSGAFDAMQKVMRRLQFAQMSVWKGHDGHDDVVDLPADRPSAGESASWSWSAALLDGAAPEIFNYKIALFNSGLEEADLGATGSAQYTRRLQTLRRYVSEGGNIYVSDYAYKVIGGSFGAPISFIDGGGGNPEIGAQGTYRAKLLEPSLVAAMGGSEVDLFLRKPQWSVIASVGPAVKTYVSADIKVYGDTQAHPNTALLVVFPVGKGRVIYSSFHATDQEDAQISKLMEYLVFEL
jgi:Carboxypeptidase regulatory-like domain